LEALEKVKEEVEAKIKEQAQEESYQERRTSKEKGRG
jgi:hypothetical protein